MKHVPWTIFATEVVCWGVLLLIPFGIFFVDITVESIVLFSVVWLFWVWMNFVAPQLLFTRKISLPKVGKHSLKIALISDLHAGPFKGARFFKRVVKHINKELPDVVLIPGDFLLGTAQRFAHKLKPLKELKMPVFFTLGNHDHWVLEPGGVPAGAEFLRSKLKQFGLRELKNESLEWKKGLWLAGVDDNFYGFDDLPKALNDVQDIDNCVLLAHSPDIVDKFNGKTPGLTVCGHTHGGQMAFPWLIKHVPHMMCHIRRMEFVWGWFNYERMFVTMGLGESASRGRWWVFPEIAILNCVEETV